MRPGSHRLAAKAAAAAAKAPADAAPAAAPAPVRAPPAGARAEEEELASAGSPPPAPSPLAEGLDSNPKPAYGQKELGRQVNRFSPEEVAYLDARFKVKTTPSVAERVEIAQELTRRRRERSERTPGRTFPELSQYQIKYWFDHRRRKVKRLQRQLSEAETFQPAPQAAPAAPEPAPAGASVHDMLQHAHHAAAALAVQQGLPPAAAAQMGAQVMALAGMAHAPPPAAPWLAAPAAPPPAAVDPQMSNMVIVIKLQVWQMFRVMNPEAAAAVDPNTVAMEFLEYPAGAEVVPPGEAMGSLYVLEGSLQVEHLAAPGQAPAARSLLVQGSFVGGLGTANGLLRVRTNMASKLVRIRH